MGSVRKRHWIDRAMGAKRGLLHGLAAKDNALTAKGTIQIGWLRRIAKGKTPVAQRARCALTLRKMQAKRK